MFDRFKRTEMLVGVDGLNHLNSARVIVFGVGGVGGAVVEALVRANIGTIDVVDNDIVDITNINRQIIALTSTIGKSKVDVIKDRAKDINPDVNIVVHKCFFLPNQDIDIDFSQYDYIVDCIDTVSAKIELCKIANEKNIRIISAMGAGNKLDPTKFVVADIFDTDYDKLAKVMRRELRKLGIKHLKVVYSREKSGNSVLTNSGKHSPGSISFVPPVMGYIMAGEVIKDILNNRG